MKKLFTLFLFAITLIASAGIFDFLNKEDKAPKYIFLFIGDGMASPQRMVAEEFARHAGHDKLVINQMPIHGTTRTGSSSSLVTDSAASGTAIACGEKTYNGSIGISSDKKRKLISSAEFAKQKGRKVGIITTVGINNATPAAFYAHRESRSMLYEIGVDMVDSGFDFFAGNGIEGNKDKKDSPVYKGHLEDYAAKNGYRVIKHSKSAFDALKQGDSRILILAGTPFAIDTPADNPFTLANLTAKGIEVLDNKNGFFMMIEGGKIDHAGHANDAATNLREVLAFDDAVRVAAEFAKKNPDETLIIVTGDHETGGMTMGFAATGYAMYMERLVNQKCSVGAFHSKLNEAKKGKADFSFEDAKKLLTQYFGFLFDGKDPKDPMQIRPDELKKLEKAFEKNRLHDEARITMAAKAGIGWSTSAHTALPVLTTASGKWAERFTGFYENTDISIRLKEIMK
jgi:alkaline phosphatase